MTTSQTHKLPIKHLLAFIAPCLPFAALGLPIVATLPEYYSHWLKMGEIVGLVFFIVRCFDIVVDPFLGLWMDKTRTKLGRFKLWMLICVPILMVSVGFIFFAPIGVTPLYLGLWLFVLYVGFSIAALSQSAWGGVLSDNYDERSKIFAWWQVGNIVGLVLVGIIPMIVQNLLHHSYIDAVRAMGAFIIILLPSMVGLALFIVPENISNSSSSGHNIGHYFMMLKRKNVRKILWADLFMGLAPGVMSALFFFFFEQTKGLAREQSNIALPLYFIAGIVGAPLWIWASKVFNKHNTLIWSSLLFAGLYGVMYFAPKGNPIICYAMVFANGIPYAASLLLTRALMADIGDEVLDETGHDHKGTLMAILSATTKLGYAISILTIYLLGKVGFNSASSHNSETSLVWLQAAFIGLPVIFLLLGALSMLGYDLTPTRFAAIQASLKQKHLT